MNIKYLKKKTKSVAALIQVVNSIYPEGEQVGYLLAQQIIIIKQDS